MNLANNVPTVELDLTRACYRITLPDGVMFIVSYQAWTEMLAKSVPEVDTSL